MIFNVRTIYIFLLTHFLITIKKTFKSDGVVNNLGFIYARIFLNLKKYVPVATPLMKLHLVHRQNPHFDVNLEKIPPSRFLLTLVEEGP